jgi:major membrane immunogen (membrane-anchored lipoprotein)
MKYIITIICNFFLLTAYGQKSASIKTQLNGKWISEDDKQYQLVFKDSIKQDLYNGKLENTYHYWIKKDSLIAKDVSSGHVFNYAIMGVTENHLTLMYLERGDLLKFCKQTAANKSLAKKRQ